MPWATLGASILHQVRGSKGLGQNWATSFYEGWNFNRSLNYSFRRFKTVSYPVFVIIGRQLDFAGFCDWQIAYTGQQTRGEHAQKAYKAHHSESTEHFCLAWLQSHVSVSTRFKT